MRTLNKPNKGCCFKIKFTLFLFLSLHLRLTLRLCTLLVFIRAKMADVRVKARTQVPDLGLSNALTLTVLPVFRVTNTESDLSFHCSRRLR